MQISIHAPPRGATVSPYSEGKLYIFQFTPLREGRRKVNDTYEEAPIFQFTPLREGRRLLDLAAAGATISIHAPPRGATFVVEAAVLAGHISIHAPPRGATNAVEQFARAFDFNSRPSARGDKGHLRRRSFPSISIHAPPRGATGTQPLRWFRRAISIHAPPRGATVCWTWPQPEQHFNSRPSARGDG